MNKLKQLSALLVLVTLCSCLGDKKQIDIDEMNDTSFVNTNFKGNLINYNGGMSACDNLNAASIAKMYDVSEELIHIEDPTKSDRYRKDMEPVCSFYIEDGENDFMWLRGSISLNREVAKDEMMGEIAEAIGGGEDWEEAWALKKSMSKSSEWIDDMGMAAIWNERLAELKIKFDGYTLNVYPIKNKLNKAEAAKNRDYKKVAIEMAKAAGYIK